MKDWAHSDGTSRVYRTAREGSSGPSACAGRCALTARVPRATHPFSGATLLGDIASFSIGMHAAMELSVPVSENVRLFVAGRVMGELYRRRQGWEIGPSIGLHF